MSVLVKQRKLNEGRLVTGNPKTAVVAYVTQIALSVHADSAECRYGYASVNNLHCYFNVFVFVFAFHQVFGKIALGGLRRNPFVVNGNAEISLDPRNRIAVHIDIRCVKRDFFPGDCQLTTNCPDYFIVAFSIARQHKSVFNKFHIVRTAYGVRSNR